MQSTDFFFPSALPPPYFRRLFLAAGALQQGCTFGHAWQLQLHAAFQPWNSRVSLMQAFGETVQGCDRLAPPFGVQGSRTSLGKLALKEAV